MGRDEGVVQMIYNRRLEILLKSRCLQDFALRHHAVAQICDTKDRYSVLLVRGNYVIEISEIIIDNYVEVWLSDMGSNLWVSSADARGICRALDIPVAVVCLLDDISIERTFISFHSEKAASFPLDFSSIESLLVYIFSHGGMGSVAHIAPPQPFNDRPYVRPMTHSQVQAYQFLSSAN
ncbi:MAG: hypothetical protein GTN84_22510 [Hydrogenophaga sp.]|nr:hypothetical protein [Hydrogenophaga sp.]NIQ49045.1 hypothetical protein [Hydrogenophaga sp.]